jgi:mono/diheme cytochrome c family protein
MNGRDLRILLLGACGFGIAVAIGIGIVAAAGAYDVAADARQSTVFGHFIAWVRERSVDVRASAVDVPALNRPEMISDGASDYDEMCTGCHLAPGMPENEMRPGLDPKPPLLASGAPGDAKIQFWIIKHGIGMTAMPAWGRTHSDKEIWNIVAFLQNLPRLSPHAYRALVARGGDHHHHEMGDGDHMKM